MPYAFLWPTLAQYSFNIIIYQFWYYYIITYYIKLKLQKLNQYVNTSIIVCKVKNHQLPNFAYILHESQAIYSEIHEYNSIYWCQFLGTLWLIIGVMVSSMTYLTLFGNTNIILSLLFGCVTIYFAAILVFIIGITSKIYYEVKAVYYPLYTLFIGIYWRPTRLKLKVNLLILSII